MLSYTLSTKGNVQLIVNGYSFVREKVRKHSCSWRCTQSQVFRCKARIVERPKYKLNDKQRFDFSAEQHNHDIVTQRRPRGSLRPKKKKQNAQ